MRPISPPQIVLAGLLLIAPTALARGPQLPSVLDGRFPWDSSQFPGQGACMASSDGGVAQTPFGLVPPPCQIDPELHFMGNPQMDHVISNVSGNPVFGPAAVPEPGTLALLVAGLGGLGWLGRRPRVG